MLILVIHSMFGKKKYWKSILIIGYLTFILWAGFIHHFQKPYAKYTHPWLNYAMFPRSAQLHTKHLILATYEGGRKGELDVASFFPMSPLLIYRGHGLGVTYGTVQELSNTSTDKNIRLCEYVLRTYNQHALPGKRLVALEIKFRYYPVTKNGWWAENPVGERFLASCSAAELSNILGDLG